MKIIGGKFKETALKVPTKGAAAKVFPDKLKEVTFDLLDRHISKWDGIHVADIFAGSGALGIEAMSRGAKNCLFIENDPDAIDCIKENLANINMSEKAEFLQNYQHLDDENKREEFDLVFLDPPYKQNLIPMALNILIEKCCLHPKTTIVVECEKDEDITIPTEFTVQTQQIHGRAKVFILTVV